MDIGEIDRIRRAALELGWRLDSIHFNGENVHIKWTDIALVGADIGPPPATDALEFQNWLEARTLAGHLRTSIIDVHSSVENALTADFGVIKVRHSRMDVADLSEEG